MADNVQRFTYTISDGTQEAIGEITITIRDLPKPELKANPYAITVDAGSVTTFDPKTVCTGPPGFRITAVSTPQFGTVQITADNQLEYTASASTPT